MKDESGLDRAALDRYITGESQTGHEDIDHECDNGHKWIVAMWYEMGAHHYEKESDALCPECGEPI